MTLLQRLELELGQFLKYFCAGARSENARRVFRMHLCCHRGKREDPLHAQLLCKRDQFAAESVLAERRLGFADEYDDVPLVLGIVPDKEPAPRQAAGTDEAAFDFDVIQFE